MDDGWIQKYAWLPECSLVNWMELLPDTCRTGTNENTKNYNINDFKKQTCVQNNDTEISIIS